MCLVISVILRLDLWNGLMILHVSLSASMVGNG